MTIAICYQSHEGIILGSDSTSSARISPIPGFTGFHYLNYHQKLYELGEDSTVGVLTWGLGGVSNIRSYRTMFALLADGIKSKPPANVADIAARWCQQFWPEYSTSADLLPFIQRCIALSGKKAFDLNVTPNPATDRTQDEENEFQNLRLNLVVGFCVAGYWPPNRESAAFEIVFDPLLGQPTPQILPPQSYKCWGAPNMIQRLIHGADDTLKQAILNSGKWNGTEAELAAVLAQQVLAHPMLPIRDAIDFVHACVYSTIKGMKFSNLFQICGGPIEIAVITSDRRFRWVRHKELDAAITEGEQ